MVGSPTGDARSAVQQLRSGKIVSATRYKDVDKPHEVDLPYLREWGKSVRWFGYAVVLCIAAAGIPIASQRLLPMVPTWIDLAIFGFLSVPVLVCFGFGTWHIMRMGVMVLRGGRPRF